jgi:hypothetical protein
MCYPATMRAKDDRHAPSEAVLNVVDRAQETRYESHRTLTVCDVVSWYATA